MNVCGARLDHQHSRNRPRKCYRTAPVSAGGLNDEQRKYAILFAATILAARKLNEIGSKPCPARECAISDAISNAELILKRIDERWPAETAS